MEPVEISSYKRGKNTLVVLFISLKKVIVFYNTKEEMAGWK